MHVVLTIAGSDSGAGAGIQADLKTFAAHGVYGTSAITAVTAQNTIGVSTWLAMPADLVTAQIEAVVGDLAVDAAKTGMLANAAIVEAVAAAIETLEIPLVVVDPVMAATSGDRLLEADAIAALRAELLPRAHVVCPNRFEAEVLGEMPIASVADAREAARRIHGFGAAAVIVTGGHLPVRDAVDVLFDGRESVELTGPRVSTGSTHGSGCTFSAALAAGLATGLPLRAAAEAAKTYVAGALGHGLALGRGQGPVDHFWRLK
jgi:hydroxymethylpyrimidine/phosphomethylpyrimidine kinase